MSQVLDLSAVHSHGKVECDICHTIIQTCKCMELGQTVEYRTCAKCKSQKAYETQQTYSELNRKLREMGVSAEVKHD
jgi:hypothetical protein